jgi:hypothetical protein
MAIYSDDRGASFQIASRPGTAAPDAYTYRLAVVTAGPNTGRILGAGTYGITKSDDGGHTWMATSEYGLVQMSARCIGVLRGEAPSGGDRVVTVINDIRILDDSIRVSVSDDGGDTWRRTDAVFPGTFRTCMEVVDLGGGRAVAVMRRGPVYGTEDAGETWTQWSQWPGGTDTLGSQALATWAVLGPDGHLYLGLFHNSPSFNVYDVRTTVPVGMITSSEAPPRAESGVAVSVRPNPSDGRVTVEIVTEAPETVRVSVFDALGREVAVVYEGPISGKLERSVETAGLAPGVYVVRASVAGRADTTVRFTVAR